MGNPTKHDIHTGTPAFTNTPTPILLNPGHKTRASRSRTRPPATPRATTATTPLPPPTSSTKTTTPRLETMVRATQTGYATADDLHAFLQTAPREVRYSGSSGKSRRGEPRVDCYVMPEGKEVIVNPGF